MKEQKCQFDKPDGCHAQVCYSDAECGSRDSKGNPRYVDSPKIEKPPVLNVEQVEDWMRQKGIDLNTYTYQHSREAQRDDTWQKAQAYYESLIQQAKAEEKVKIKEEIKKSLLDEDELVGNFFDKATPTDYENTLLTGLKEVAQAQLDKVLKILT